MKKILIILFCLPIMFFSCVNNSQKNKSKNPLSNAIISFNVTSKNPELTSNSGKDVSLNEMITINVKSNDNIFFNDINFTLDNKVDGAVNFYSDSGNLVCNSPTNIFLMSMPPTGNGLTAYNKGDNIVIKGTTLIKINSINFVISNIKSDLD